MAPEPLPLDEEQQQAYDTAWNGLMQVSSNFLAPIPSVVSLAQPPDPMSSSISSSVSSSSDEVVTIITPSRGHHELYRSLEQLEGLEKEEHTLLEHAWLTKFLTEIVTSETYTDARHALETLEALGQAVPRRVCQHPFRKNDIVWVCRTCQADETCVLCHACFSQSDHEGHDVAFYHAQAGGCCDCGDPDAWDPVGFCPYHGPNATLATTMEEDDANVLSPALVHRVRGVVPACVDWMVQTVAQNAEEAFRRAHPRKPTQLRKVESDVIPHPHFPLKSRSLPFEDDDYDQDSMDEDHEFMESQVFSPMAASASRASRDELSHQDELAEQLGRVGAAGHGLFIVLFADDIHSSAQFLDAVREFLGGNNFYTDTLLGKLARALRQYGYLIMWGTMEMVAECGATQVRLWFDGDKVACTRIGAVALDRVRRLTKHGLFCSIATFDELMVEQRAVYVLQWLSAVARSCDPLCQTVAECILPNRHLVPLLRADFKISARVTKAWYSLLLTLLAVPTFKSHLAAAYCDTYRNVTAKYARGMGVLERTGHTLSVQFLNRVTYVVDLVQGRDLLGKLGKAILETLLVACQPGHLNRRLNPNHAVLTHRRYSPCVSDLKCVLNVKGMSRIFACEEATFMDDWIASLSLAQMMDPHEWRHWTLGHVETESRGWVGAFNLSISLGSLFERLLGWADEDLSPIQDPTSPYARGLLSCVDMTFRILSRGVNAWERAEVLYYEPTVFSSDIEPHRRCPASLPFSTVTAKRGAALAMKQLPVSQVTPFSFHLPLHRFVASCLRELCFRPDDDRFGMTGLSILLRTKLNDKEYDDLFRHLMEFPVLVLSRAAQVRAGLWRRSGPGVNDQVLNYSEPPFCRTMRDADLLIAQFATLGRVHTLSPLPRPENDVGVAFLVNLLIHRLGIFDYLGFAKAPNWDINRYTDEVAMGLYPKEVVVDGSADDDHALPWTYTPARDSASCMVLLEEFLHFIIMFSSELPLPAPVDRTVHTKQAQFKLHREVVHRLASGPKTHSEVSEVQHVLSHWDNVLLSEEGKKINPDDATGAALGTVLANVAERKASRGKLEPDKWEMKREAWDSYDPAFFHISLRSHQSAAENRPKPSSSETSPFGWDPRPYAPEPTPGHRFFSRLRRDISTDASILAVAYRVLHLHCRQNTERPLTDLRGKSAYESKDKSETALARAVHLLTLGAYAWVGADSGDVGWREKGGGSAGSLFFNRPEDSPAPTETDWIRSALLTRPSTLVGCNWHDGEDCMLVLLKHLALTGGLPGEFVAQDSSVRAGAAWLCRYAVSQCTEAQDLIAPTVAVVERVPSDLGGESEMERRKKQAKEKAMAKMKAQAARFAALMDVGLEDNDDDGAVAVSPSDPSGTSSAPSTPRVAVRANSVGSAHSSASSAYSSGLSDLGSVGTGPVVPFPSGSDSPDLSSEIPTRLLRVRPRCIICNYEETPDTRVFDSETGEGQRKRSKRRNENALAWVTYAQPSTVLRGGGGCPTHESTLPSLLSPVRDFVGVHVALCGHAVHSECCESYLATVSQREDRVIGKRDEFRCPMCQRLSNCLVPFIDVGADWVESPKVPPVATESLLKSDLSAAFKKGTLQSFLSETIWWVTRRNLAVAWDDQSAFVDPSLDTSVDPSDEGSPRGKVSRTRRAVRSLKKKDIYTAWNAMMKTPRFVRRRLRPRGSGLRDSTTSRVQELSLEALPDVEESSGETTVWRRFMDQISDTSYRADGRRLGDDRLHNNFGEFRHYVVEKHAYNMANPLGGASPVDWPSCMFSESVSDLARQEMSREKLLSKLLLSVQSFTYSVSCESFEARRRFRKCVAAQDAAGAMQDSSSDSVLTNFGITGLACGGNLVVMPRPLTNDEDGSQPFDGRLGKLRYLALALMAAAGAVAADLVQIALPLPARTTMNVESAMDIEKPLRSPVAYPILFGHVLTHVVAAMCAVCGRGRALSDALDLVWPVPVSHKGSFVFSDDFFADNPADSVTSDCEGFMKLGMIARILQVLLGKLKAPTCGFSNPRGVLEMLESLASALEQEVPNEIAWIKTCCKLLSVALTKQPEQNISTNMAAFDPPNAESFRDACLLAASAAAQFLSDTGVVLQLLVPGVMGRYQGSSIDTARAFAVKEKSDFDDLRTFFLFEPLDEMLESVVAQEVIVEWYAAACRHAKAGSTFDLSETVSAQALRSRLFRTQGYRPLDWPSPRSTVSIESTMIGRDKDSGNEASVEQPHFDAPPSPRIPSLRRQSSQSSTTTAEVLRAQQGPPLVTFSSKKTVSLLGGLSPDLLAGKTSRPRVTVIPTSYTDLYAELGTLLPDCEQTAVCLICGEVLNAGGKGECTRHTFKCGAGAGMFFLLQECSGLILHKSKAAYIHSPYVDSHGETPQFRGRPLNLDMGRYEHLRGMWMGHGIRQTVVAERGSSRQVILPDFY